MRRRGEESVQSDIPAVAFLRLRAQFFDGASRPIPFRVRDKRNTQDDPLDEMLGQDVLNGLEGITTWQASGPLVTPDMVLFRPERCLQMSPQELAGNTEAIVAIEVKKLERTRQGKVARASGLDYNTTPPCGRVRVFDADGTAVDIRSFYLFVCLEPVPTMPGLVAITALCLIDGNALNEDFDLYLRITGQRTKHIGLGSYGDGADRARPMMIFANPLGAKELDRAATLVHEARGLAHRFPDLALAYQLNRSTQDGKLRTFYCYRAARDVPPGWEVQELCEPFPTPTRETLTRPRGRFRLPFRLAK